MRYMTCLIISLLALATGCLNDPDIDDHMDHRQAMRDLVMNISAHARSIDDDFIIIPQNGHELLTTNGEPDGPLSKEYMDSIEGIGREDLFYGYLKDNVRTPTSETDNMLPYLGIALENDLTVLVTDYCWSEDMIEDSYFQNDEKGFISFAADHRELDDVPAFPPSPHDVNSDNISGLTDARNFLYVLDPEPFGPKDAFLGALRDTEYDLLIIDAFFDGQMLSADDIGSLKVKSSGGERLVIAYMSIGEAEDYRFYWKDDWKGHPPSWLDRENPDWEGNYKVRYWDPEWQDLIFGGEGAYLDRIIDNGFDGVYLDLIDAYEYFE